MQMMLYSIGIYKQDCVVSTTPMIVGVKKGKEKSQLLVIKKAIYIFFSERQQAFHTQQLVKDK